MSMKKRPGYTIIFQSQFRSMFASRSNHRGQSMMWMTGVWEATRNSSNGSYYVYTPKEESYIAVCFNSQCTHKKEKKKKKDLP